MSFAIVLLATACGSAGGPGSDTSQTEAIAPTTEAASVEAKPTPAVTTTAASMAISEAATCAQLIGPNEDGPLIDGVTIVTSLTLESPPDPAEVETTVSEIETILEYAAEDMRPYLTVFLKPLDDLLAAFNGELGGDYNFNEAEWKAAGTELLTRCGNY